jgi:DNA-binding MarR family transcriptional regulator
MALSVSTIPNRPGSSRGGATGNSQKARKAAAARDQAIGCDEAIAGIESALHALARCLKQARLHEFLLKQAGVDVDQAGLAVLYALHAADSSLRLTDLADRLRIDAPAVTRKAQQLERMSLVSWARDPEDARAARLQLTASGRQLISQFLLARRE